MSGFLILAALAQAASPQAPTETSPASVPTTAPHIGSSTYLDAEAGLGYSTNPFQAVGSGTGQGFGRLSLHAVHTRISDRTTTVLSAYAQDVTYTGHYGSAQSFDVNGRHDASVNERLHLYIDGDAAYDRGGQLDTRILAIPAVPLLPGTTVPPALLTSGSDFLNVTGRTYRENGDFGGSYALSARDSINFTAGIGHTVFKTGPADTSFTQIPLSIGYDRQINEVTSIGARVAAQLTHYSRTLTSPAGNVDVVTPEVTAEFKLSPRLTLSGDVGASFSSIREGGLTRHSTGFAGDLALCSLGERTRLCARGSVQQQAATSAGPASVATLELDYSRQLSADETIQASISGNRYSSPTIILARESFSRATYLRAAIDYSRKIGRRWFGGIDLAARKITHNGPDPKADISASLFIRYRFGDVQ